MLTEHEVNNDALMKGYGLIETEFLPEKYQPKPLTEQERADIVALCNDKIWQWLTFKGNLDGFDAAETVRSAYNCIMRLRYQ